MNPNQQNQINAQTTAQKGQTGELNSQQYKPAMGKPVDNFLAKKSYLIDIISPNTILS